MQGGDTSERRGLTIKAADDATRLFIFYQSGAKNGDSAVLIVGDCAMMMRRQRAVLRVAGVLMMQTYVRTEKPA